MVPDQSREHACCRNVGQTHKRETVRDEQEGERGVKRPQDNRRRWRVKREHECEKSVRAEKGQVPSNKGRKPERG